MQRMGWTLPFTIGNLHLLWWWALDFAPDGDLTHFEPEQLTYDLDLGCATPEEFIDAMVYAGFLDRVGDALLIHDWLDYTAKSLRPKRKSVPAGAVRTDCKNNASAPEQSTSPRDVRDPQLVEHGPQGAVRVDCVEDAAREGGVSGSERSQHGPQGAVRVDCVEDAAREGGVSGSERSQMALRAVPNLIQADFAPHVAHAPAATAFAEQERGSNTVSESPDICASAQTETFARHTSQGDVGVASCRASSSPAGMGIAQTCIKKFPNHLARTELLNSS